MTRKNNTVRLTEAELHQLIESVVMETINEGRFGDMAKKVGKGIAKAGLYGALTAGGVTGCGYALDKGLENQERYEQRLNQEARMMNLGNEQDVQEWLQERGLEDNEFNRQQAYDYFEGIADEYFQNNPVDEAKKARPVINEQRIAQILRKNLQRAKKA